MCNAITKKGTQCYCQPKIDGFCLRHYKSKSAETPENKEISDYEFDDLVKRICSRFIRKSDKIIIKNFDFKSKLISIVIKYDRHFGKDLDYLISVIEDLDIGDSWNIVKDDLCNKPTVKRVIDSIETMKCLLELTKLFIVIFEKIHPKISFMTPLMLIKNFNIEIKNKEKIYEEEQLNILRTKEVGTLNVFGNDVYKHIFVGYL
jgi:hypothetical protein